MMGRNPLQTFLACKVNFKSNLLSQFDFLSLIRQIKLQIAQNQVPLSDIFLYCLLEQESSGPELQVNIAGTF